MVTILYYVRLLFLLVDGSTLKGIRNRTWFAVLVAIIAIAVDTAYVYSVYDYIPRSVPALRDWDNQVVEWASKTEFFKYEVERILVLVVLLVCGFSITLLKPKSLIAKRTRCFLAETAMLVITTGVCISTVELALSLGDKLKEQSDYWEWSVMIFWFAISMIEYIYDCRKIKKKNSSTR